jgi:CelD/BcsL family acetyltransferase involved in cellulose biosynthesis
LGAWRAIQSEVQSFSGPYFCPEFTQAVASVRSDVRVVVIENRGRTVGFFPHQRSSLGMGKPVGGPLSDFHGVIAVPGSDWNLYALMRAARLSVWAFDHLAGDIRQFEPCIAASADSPQIDLHAGYERYVQERRAAGSDYIPKTEGLGRKCAREHGEIEFALHDPDPEALAQLFRWKSGQYRSSGIANVFGVSWTQALLRRICGYQGHTFAGLCSTLRVNGRIVAVHAGMRSRDTLHYWFPAYDVEFSKFSVGNLLLLRMARSLPAYGVRTIDLGKGGEQYKERLMSGRVQLYEGCVELPSLLTYVRRLRRAVEMRAARGGLGTALQLPLRAIRRIERARRFS